MRVAIIILLTICLTGFAASSEAAETSSSRELAPKELRMREDYLTAEPITLFVLLRQLNHEDSREIPE